MFRSNFPALPFPCAPTALEFSGALVGSRLSSKYKVFIYQAALFSLTYLVEIDVDSASAVNDHWFPLTYIYGDHAFAPVLGNIKVPSLSIYAPPSNSQLSKLEFSTDSIVGVIIGASLSTTTVLLAARLGFPHELKHAPAGTVIV